MAKKKPFLEEFEDRLKAQLRDLFGNGPAGTPDAGGISGLAEAWKMCVPAQGHEFNVFIRTPDGNGGVTTTKVLRVPATPEQTRFFEMDPPLRTGIEWNALGLAGRVKVAAELQLPSGLAKSLNMVEVLPQEAREYLAFWQRQINSAECAFSAHEIGARAARLLEQGYLLGPRVERTDWTGDRIRPRDRVPPGQPGSYRFVEAIMGPEYAKWIAEFSV
jgi:hypothetical protein